MLGIDGAVLRDKLQGYISRDGSYKAVYEYTMQSFNAANHLMAHNWEHAYRDTLNAIVIGEAEGADMGVVLPAATMHDIGFLYGADGPSHAKLGAEKVAEFLTNGGILYPPDVVDKIARCILTHKGSMFGDVPQSLEAKVVADADMLEKFGPVGVYQSIRTYTEFNWPLDQVIARSGKLADLTLETETGRKLAAKGRKFTADFFDALEAASAPYLAD